jgi:hypothetical protein
MLVAPVSIHRVGHVQLRPLFSSRPRTAPIVPATDVVAAVPRWGSTGRANAAAPALRISGCVVHPPEIEQHPSLKSKSRTPAPEVRANAAQALHSATAQSPNLVQR